MAGPATISQDVQQALDLYRTQGVPEIAALSPDLQKDWNVAVGFQQYNLEAPAKIMFPQLTPIRNLTPRDSGAGKQAEFKAVTAINTGHQNGWVAEKTAANIITTSTIDIITPYRSMALADTVSFESTWAGRTFMDIKALAVMNLLRATMIQEENNILFGQNSSAAASQQSPGAVGAAPTLTGAQATTTTTGGHLPATTNYFVWETVVTGMGESLPSAASFSITTGSGSVNSISLTPLAVTGQPVFGYNFYISTTNTSTTARRIIAGNLVGGVSPSSGTLNGQTWATNGAAVVLDNVTTLGVAAPPVADGSASSLAYNGLIPQIYGGAGATITPVNGALTGAAIDAMFLNLWNSANGDPNTIFCNSQESVKISNITFGAGAPYFVVPEGGQNTGVAGFRAAKVINKVTGSEVPVTVHPTIPQGFMLFLSAQMPSWYVPSEIPNVFDLSMVQDYVEIDYPPTQAAPYWQVEVRCYGALRLYLPLIQGVLSGVSNT